MAQLRAKQIWNTALISAVFLVCIDRFLKAVSIIYWQEYPQHILNGLSLVFIKNSFIAFSLNTFFQPLLFIIPAITFLLFYFFYLLKNQRLLEASALFFILGGAFSNVYDRLFYGYVIDYFDLKYFTIFNVADVMICGGVIFLIIYYFKKNNKNIVS
jgi:signal peptidase II